MADTPFAPIIRTQSDLQGAWRQLMGPWGYGGNSIWMMLILDDDRPLPQLIETAECDGLPGPEHAHGLAEVLRTVIAEFAPGGRVAFLRSRPGSTVTTEADRAWARMLHAAAHSAGVQCEVVHLATRGVIRPLPRDDIGTVERPA